MNNLGLKQLTEEEINKNRVNTINQYRILQYLKNNLNIYAFKVYLYSRDIIMVIDKKPIKKMWKGLLMYPIFLGSWLLINFKCLFINKTNNFLLIITCKRVIIFL